MTDYDEFEGEDGERVFVLKGGDSAKTVAASIREYLNDYHNKEGAVCK